MIEKVKVSAPHRLDIGGTWDLAPLLLFGRAYHPQTITIALDLRTRIQIEGISSGIELQVTDREGIQTDWSGSGIEEYDFLGDFGLIQAILAFFNMQSIRIEMSFDLPSRIGLGGSGALAVALISACMEYKGDRNAKRGDAVAEIAHIVESGIFSITGYQDQLSAVRGGVNLWMWDYPGAYSRALSLLPPDGYPELEDRLVIAVFGVHSSSDVNQKQVDAFMRPGSRPKWVDLNDHTKAAANAIEARDWPAVIDAVKGEHQIRNEIAPERLQGSQAYSTVVRNRGGAFATAGSGQAVCWYLGVDATDAQEVSAAWATLNADMLPTKISAEGLK